MLHTLLTQARFDRVTLVPADAVMNTWHWQWDDAEPDYNTLAELEAEIFARLNAFYTAIDGFLSDFLAPSTNQLVTFDLADPQPRTPIIVTEDAINLADLDGANVSEIAIVLSFRAVNPPGTDARRYRNRVYLGPVSTASGAAGVSDIVVNSTCMTAITNAAQDLLDANDAGLAWVVYSPTDAVVRGIDNGFVDNAYDTQRRRGAQATTRVTFGLP